MTDDISEIGDEVGLRRLVRQAIERAQAMDMPEADKRAWIAYIEEQYWRARAAALGDLPELDFDPIDL